MARKPSWNCSMCIWTCFLYLGVYPRVLLISIVGVVFWTVTNWTITNYDKLGIYAVAICDLLQFVIKAVMWHIDSNNTDNVFWVFGGVPRFTFDMNMKSFVFAHCGGFFFSSISVCISVIMPIIHLPSKPSWKGPMSMWTCFLYLRVYPRLLWNLSEKFCFEPSQIATVTNCDNSWIPAVPICDLSQFVIKALTAQTECYNTENVFCVLGRVPKFNFNMNMKSCIFAYFGVISLLYLYVCMYISYKVHKWCNKETFLKLSDVYVNVFSVLRSIPSVTIDINLKSCILNRHKMRQSQIATKRESLPS